jgi:5-oxoprolinase (ATP-hydrolysing) subunit C
MVLEVLAPGPATTVQDGGRPGFGAFGVPEGGAIDRGLLATANGLAGNAAGAPALEFALKGPRLRWRGRTRLRCVLAGDSIREVTLAPGDELDAGSLRRRVYGYLAVGGGFEVPLVMGGRGTCLPGGFGGLFGRELRKGDRLPVDAPGRVGTRAHPAVLGREARHAPDLAFAGDPLTVRVLPGDRPKARARTFGRLVAAGWRAGAGNRVGIRLEGPTLEERALHLSQPIPPGALQVTGGGQPILLLRDHPTIGGYPVVAVVMAADLDACAQLRPGDRLRFVAG